MAKHHYIGIIETYYDACNQRDAELMVSTFTDDIVHYFVDHEPVRSAAGLANYWCKVAPRTEATWKLDHALVDGSEAVIEWSMRWRPSAKLDYELLRGTEWFFFVGNKIAEIRSYHCNFFLSDRQNRQLRDFDYANRGYTSEN
tara:strand:- start:56 stop:484 length:429 start_codon:yes stop_codon:yes gene_type:complete